MPDIKMTPEQMKTMMNKLRMNSDYGFMKSLFPKIPYPYNNRGVYTGFFDPKNIKLKLTPLGRLKAFNRKARDKRLGVTEQHSIRITPIDFRTVLNDMTSEQSDLRRINKMSTRDEIDEAIELTKYVYDMKEPGNMGRNEITMHGQKVLEFVAEHFDVRPLTQDGVDAIEAAGSDSAVNRIFKNDVSDD